MTAPFSRRLNRFVAQVLLGVMLFVQALVAAHACSAEERSASFGAVPAVPAEHCHEEKGVAAPAADRDTCLAHCSLSGQSLDKPQVSVHALPATPLLTLPLAAASAEQPRLAPRVDEVAGGDPPIPILFQVFRN